MPNRGINNNEEFSRLGSSKGTRRGHSRIITAPRVILVVSVIGLTLTLSSFGSNWPYSLLGALGVDSRINQANVLDVLQIPALVFFVFLTLYAIKATIDEYRRSFDQPKTRRPGSVNRAGRKRASQSRHR